MIMTYQQMRAVLIKNDNMVFLRDFDRIFRSDGDYFIPSSEWYEKEFFPWYKLQLRNYHVQDYALSWDCDKYATSFQVFANICHAQTSPDKSEGLAIGVVHYLPDNSESMHAINCVFVDNGELRFIEPQVPEFITLSDREQKNIDFIKF
ncbi:MAG: hypothetical protein PF692_12845 [Kiritimatiellae bacterium]|jgi:hypothetical protein|nr:hypothetical protein [Kiritimatiellia bacterium]